MADNISQIGEVISNLNTTFNVSVTDFQNQAIQQGNEATGGYLGIIVLILLAFTTIVYIGKNRARFLIFERSSLFLISLSVILDLSLILMSQAIMNSLNVFGWIFTTFFLVGIFSFMKKETQNIGD